MKAAILAIVLAAVAAGCGSDTGSTTTLADAQSCLSGKGATIEAIDGEDEFFTATGGAIEVELGGERGVVAVGADSDEANEIADSMSGIATAFGAEDVDDIVRTQGNVAYWSTGESDEILDEIEDCL